LTLRRHAGTRCVRAKDFALIPIMNKTALVLGVSGQDGAYLAKLLLEKGYRVVGSSRDAQISTFANLARLGIKEHVQTESVSANDFRSVLQVLKKVEPDEVYNLAGQSSVGLSFSQPMETFESIGIGTLNLLETIRMLEMPVRFYNAGSSECFGNTGGERANEETPFRPRSPYAVAKAAAFWQVANYREAYKIFACSGLLFNHESPLRPERFVTQKIVREACQIKAGLQEKMKLGNISVERDWGWAPEYVEAMWLMLQQDKASDYIVATGKTFSLEALVETVFSYLGLDWREHVELNQDLLRPTDIKSSLADPGKAERELGWKAKYGMQEVVTMMVDNCIESMTR